MSKLSDQVMGMTPRQLENGDWKIVMNALIEAKTKLSENGLGNQSWLDAPISISSERSLTPDPVQLGDWMAQEFERKPLVFAESDALKDMQSFWVVWDSEEGAVGRTISWLCGCKEISEGAGPRFLDCPLYFFELAPTVLHQEWRDECAAQTKCVTSY